MPKASKKKKKALIRAYLERGQPVRSGNRAAPTNQRYGVRLTTSGLLAEYVRKFGNDLTTVLEEMEDDGEIVINRGEHARRKNPSWVIYSVSRLPPNKPQVLWRFLTRNIR